MAQGYLTRTKGTMCSTQETSHGTFGEVKGRNCLVLDTSFQNVFELARVVMKCLLSFPLGSTKILEIILGKRN